MKLTGDMFAMIFDISKGCTFQCDDDDGQSSVALVRPYQAISREELTKGWDSGHEQQSRWR